MHHSSRIFRIIFPLILSACMSESAFACAIQNSPSPLLSSYIKDVTKRASEIRSFGTANNKCNGKTGTFSVENRFLSLIDRVDSQTSGWWWIVQDFEYSILLTARWESRWPVTTHATLIRNLETQTLVPALKNVAAACALDGLMPNGKTPEEELSNLLANNRSLETFYKNVALGDPTLPQWLTEYQEKLYLDIQKNYSPEVTASCKGSESIDSIEELMTKIQERLQGQATKTNNKQNDWEEALALFAGKWTSTKKYQDLQRRLLSAELARQWLTGKARDAMLGNLTCFQSNTTPTSTVEEMGEARSKCLQSGIIGAENLTNWYKPLVFKATNTDEFLRRTLIAEKSRTRLGPDITSFWKQIQETKNTDEKLNEKMVTDLINIHAELVLTNELLCKKSQEMYKNCMKGDSSIPCPQVKCN